MEKYIGKISRIKEVNPDDNRPFQYSVTIVDTTRGGTMTLVSDSNNGLQVGSTYELEVEPRTSGPEVVIVNHFITRATQLRQ